MTIDILFFETSFREIDELNQSKILLTIQSQYDDDQIQKSNLNILASRNETLMNLMKVFFETRQEKNITQITCFFEQKFSNVDAIYKGSRKQIDQLFRVSQSS